MIFIVVGMLVVMVSMVLSLGVVVLKGVALANFVVGGRATEHEDYEFSRTSWTPQVRSRAGLAVPPPSGGQALVLVVTAAALTFCAQVALEFAGRELGVRPGASAWLTVVLLGIPAGFVIRAVLYRAMLPTTFGRACVVALFEMLIYFLIGLVVGFGLAAAGRLPGMGR